MISSNEKYYKNILHLDLTEQVAQIKIVGDVYEYIGGVSLAYKLLEEYYEDKPIVITSGPLSGYFPYISKSCLLTIENRKFVEKYGGGTLAAKMNYAGLDAIVIVGEQKTPFIDLTVLPDEITLSTTEADKYKSDLIINEHGVFSLGYFSFGDFSETKLNQINSLSLKIDSSLSVDLKNIYEYENLYNSILDLYRELTVEPRNNPSCMGCPMGCDLSSLGEDDLNVAILPRSLISCGYASRIYKQIPTVFACLSTIGYDYTHSDLENLPEIFSATRERIRGKMEEDNK